MEPAIERLPFEPAMENLRQAVIEGLDHEMDPAMFDREMDLILGATDQEQLFRYLLDQMDGDGLELADFIWHLFADGAPAETTT